MSKALSFLSNSLAGRTAFAPFGYPTGSPTATSISKYIAPVQFERLAHDIRMWRDAIREMELAFWPMRVRAQRMYMDVAENPYVKAVIERYKELTIERDYTIYQIKGGKRVQSDILTENISSQTWFDDYVEYTLDARLYGYSLIELGDLINDEFPNISFTRRENIRPDGYGDSGPLLTSLVYSVDGVPITKNDDPLIPLFNHWIPTKSNRGVSACGYGLLYNLALYEIHLRHILEWNVDYAEMYGMPIKKGFTNKTGKERDKFESFLRNAASNSYVLLDKNTNDDIEYVMAQSAGTAWKTYENLEGRLQGSIAQLVLGHTDAMRSTPGKLGGMQAANKDGFNESLIEQAMNSKQTAAGNFVSRAINAEFSPKMRALGKKVGSKKIKELIPEGYYFGLLNDKEEEEIKRRRNAQNLIESQVLLNLSKAGYKRDAIEAGQWMNMDLHYDDPTSELKEERVTTTTQIDGDVPSQGSTERSLK